jgi:hypothetical protein
MEMSQWNILYSYLKQTKMSLFYHFYIYFHVYIVWDTSPPGPHLSRQNKNVFCFSKLENRKAKQILSGGIGISGRRGGYMERVWDSKYGRNII